MSDARTSQAVSQLLVSAPPTLFPVMRNMKQPLAALFTAFALVGMILLYVTPAAPELQNRRLASVILISCSAPNYAVVIAVIGANTAGFTRKQVAISTSFFLYCIINIITPQTFLGSESPRYYTGLGFVIR
jgi:MFS transporter, ACS family, allantoate permease